MDKVTIVEAAKDIERLAEEFRKRKGIGRVWFIGHRPLLPIAEHNLVEADPGEGGYCAYEVDGQDYYELYLPVGDSGYLVFGFTLEDDAIEIHFN